MSNCTEALPFAYHGIAAIGSSMLVGLLGFAAIILLLWRHRGFSQHLDNSLLSFGAGAMLGEALFHIIPLIIFPSPAEDHDHAEWLALWLLLVFMAGFTVFFVIEVSLPHEHSSNSDEDASESISILHPEVEAKVNWKRVIMVLTIDAMHNFLDAVALGAAWRFWQDGLSLFLAIFLHEIGHEMANFIFLVKLCRMSEKRALLWNGLTALVSNLGAIIGWLLSSDIEDATEWILAFAGGGFLYMSNAQIIPVLLQNSQKPNRILNITITLLPFTLGLLLIFGLVASQKGGLMKWC